MKYRISLLTAALTMFALLLVPSAAKADPLQINFTAGFQSGADGTTLQFDATITNTSASNVYLNSDSLSLEGFLVSDDSPFFNSPLFLAPGDFYTGELFTVNIPIGTPTGLYAGNFTIIGGDASDFIDPAGSADFNVNVTPEPPTVITLASAMSILFLLSSRRHRRPGQSL